MQLDQSRLSDVNSLTTALRQKIRIISIQNDSISQLLMQNRGLQEQNNNLKQNIQFNQERANEDVIERDRIVAKQQMVIQQLQERLLQQNQILGLTLLRSNPNDMSHQLDQMYNEYCERKTHVHKPIEQPQAGYMEPSPSINDISMFSNYNSMGTTQLLENVAPLPGQQAQNTINLEGPGDSFIAGMYKQISTLKTFSQSQVNQMNNYLMSTGGGTVVQALLSPFYQAQPSLAVIQFVISVLKWNRAAVQEVLQSNAAFKQVVELSFVAGQANEQKLLTQILDEAASILTKKLSVSQCQVVHALFAAENIAVAGMQNKGKIVECLLKCYFYAKLLSLQQHPDILVFTEQVQLNINHLNHIFLSYIETNKPFCKLLPKYYEFDIQCLLSMPQIDNIQLNIQQVLVVVSQAYQIGIFSTMCGNLLQLLIKLTGESKQLVRQNVNVANSLCQLKKTLGTSLSDIYFNQIVQLVLNYCQYEPFIMQLVPGLIALVKNNPQAQQMSRTLLGQMYTIFNQNQGTLRPYNYTLICVMVRQYTFNQELDLGLFQTVLRNMIVPYRAAQQEDIAPYLVRILQYEQNKLDKQQFVGQIHQGQYVTVVQQPGDSSGVRRLNMPLLGIVCEVLGAAGPRVNCQALVAAVLASYSHEFGDMLSALLALTPQLTAQTILGFVYAGNIVARQEAAAARLRAIVCHSLGRLRTVEPPAPDVCNALRALSLSELAAGDAANSVGDLVAELLGRAGR